MTGGLTRITLPQSDASIIPGTCTVGDCIGRVTEKNVSDFKYIDNKCSSAFNCGGLPDINTTDHTELSNIHTLSGTKAACMNGGKFSGLVCNDPSKICDLGADGKYSCYSGFKIGKVGANDVCLGVK